MGTGVMEGAKKIVDDGGPPYLRFDAPDVKCAWERTLKQTFAAASG